MYFLHSLQSLDGWVGLPEAHYERRWISSSVLGRQLTLQLDVQHWNSFFLECLLLLICIRLIIYG